MSNILFIGQPSPELLQSIPELSCFYLIDHNIKIYLCEVSQYKTSAYSLDSESRLFIQHDSDIGATEVVSNLDVLQEIPYISDLWSRWGGENCICFSDFLAECTFKVNSIVDVLKKTEISKAFACYSSPHHVWNNLAELALKYAGIITYRLYPFLESNHVLALKACNHHKSIITPIVANLAANPASREIVLKYIKRTREQSFSTASKACFRRRHSSPYLAKAAYLYNLFRHRGNTTCYHPLAFLGVANSLAMHRINLSHRMQSEAMHFYLKNIVNLDSRLSINKPSFLFCAHFQPESTTVPDGGEYHSHLTVISILRRKFPNSLILYKEHPGAFSYTLPGWGQTLVGLNRSLNYYKFLLQQGVKFVDPFVNVSTMLSGKKLLFPVSITGSICLEAPLGLGIPSLYFGYPYFNGYPGAIDAKLSQPDQVIDQLQYLSADPVKMIRMCEDWLFQVATATFPNFLGYGMDGILSVPDQSTISFLKELYFNGLE